MTLDGFIGEKSNNGYEFSVQDLAFKLKERIKKHGIKAVWEQLDQRFKVSEEKVLEGIKSSPNKNKITFKAFEKAVERLTEIPKAHEKMTFNVRGNPLLMMNVFQVLGIKGFADLCAEDFAPPNPTAKIYAIDSKIDKLSEQLEALVNDIDMASKQPPRIAALKLYADFSAITGRLSSVLENNTDSFVAIFRSINTLPAGKRIVEKQEHNEADAADYVKLLQNFHRDTIQSKQNAFFNKLVSDMFPPSGEDKRISFFYNILFDYKVYCNYHKLLHIYVRNLFMKAPHIDPNKMFLTSSQGILSPAYILLFYLLVAEKYASKLDGHKPQSTPKYLQERLDAYRKGISQEKFIESMLHNLMKQVVKVLQLFATETHKVGTGIYEDFKKALTEAVNILKDLFINIDTESDNEIVRQLQNIGTLESFFSMKERGVFWDYNLTVEIVGRFEGLLNTLSNLAKKTARNIHE